MRLKPPVDEETALQWLKTQVAAAWGVEMTPELERRLRETAASVAAISAVELPEEIEPLLI
jgi:hypothetical protein